MYRASTNGGAVPIVRKPDGTLVVGVRITLKPGRDDDLIDLVLSAQKLAPAIREAMRSGVVIFASRSMPSPTRGERTSVVSCPG